MNLNGLIENELKVKMFDFDEFEWIN